MLELDDIIEWHKEGLRLPLQTKIQRQTPNDQNIEIVEMEEPEEIARNLDDNETINQLEPENQIVEMEKENPEDIAHNLDKNETINQAESENQIVEMEEPIPKEIAQNHDGNQSIEVEYDRDLAMRMYNKIKTWYEEQLQALEHIKTT